MATFTLKSGDFGSGVGASFSDEELFLPNPRLPGTREVAPILSIAQVESVSQDLSNVIKEGVKQGLRGAVALGPVGLAAGVLAVRKVRDVNFTVRLKDGRQFLATADAVTYSALRSAHMSARLSEGMRAGEDDVDRVIQKYLRPEPAPAAAAKPAAATAPAAGAPADAPATPTAPKPGTPTRPTFGRRRA